MNFKGLLTYVFLGLLIIQYQNCAPSASDLNEDSALYSDETSEIDGDRSTINRVQVGSIFFPQKAFHISEESEAGEIAGICEQQGSLISWTLRAEDGTLVDRGQSPCERGSFVVDLDMNMDKHCEDLVLKAALGAKASSEMTIVASCELED